MLEKVARTLRLSEEDNVVVATERTEPGAEVAKGITAHQRIPFGHKVAIQPIAKGEPVRKFGQMLVADHMKSMEKLTQVAAAHQVPAPAAVDPGMRSAAATTRRR